MLNGVRNILACVVGVKRRRDGDYFSHPCAPLGTRTLKFPLPLPPQASNIQHGMIHRSTRAATIVDQIS